MDGIFYRFGDFIARFRFLVVAFWVAALVVAIPGVKNLSSALVSGGFDVPASDPAAERRSWTRSSDSAQSPRRC